MKRNILAAFVAIACLVVAAPAFAVATFTSTATTIIGGASLVPSTNVTLSAAALPSTDATNPNTYCVSAVHGAAVGTNNTAGKAYGARNTDPGILHKDAPATVAECACSDSLGWACTMIQ